MPNSPASLYNLEDADWADGVSHNGGEAGSQTLLFVLPKAKTFAVVLTSTSGNSEEAADMLMNDLLAAATGRLNGGAKEGCKYPSKVSTGIVVGAVLGALAFVGVIVAVVYCCNWR